MPDLFKDFIQKYNTRFIYNINRYTSFASHFFIDLHLLDSRLVSRMALVVVILHALEELLHLLHLSLLQ